MSFFCVSPVSTDGRNQQSLARNDHSTRNSVQGLDFCHYIAGVGMRRDALRDGPQRVAGLHDHGVSRLVTVARRLAGATAVSEAGHHEADHHHEREHDAATAREPNR
jgi:hypothetical protein